MVDQRGGGPPQPTEEPAFVRKVRGHAAFGPGDHAALAQLCGERQTVRRGALLIERARTGEAAFLVERGWAMRYAILPDGSRQILAFVLPGDIVGFGGLILGRSSESVAAITPLRVAPLTAAALEAAVREHPGLRRAFLWSHAQDVALLCDRLISLGRRPALERVARTLLELARRWNAVRDAADGAALPLTQPMLADALGLSTVHVNRTLQRLRGRGLISSQRGPILVEDATALARVANIEAGDPLHALAAP